MVNSQPILISPLPLPPVSCWREILKLLDGQVCMLIGDQFLKFMLNLGGWSEAH